MLNSLSSKNLQGLDVKTLRSAAASPSISDLQGIDSTLRRYSISILFLACFMCAGSYYAFDSIQNFAPLFASQLHIDATEFGALYSVYSLPNVILPFFGGVMGDKLGLPRASAGLSALVTTGAVIVALAPSVSIASLGQRSHFYLMLLGRFIFGAGAESLNVIQSAIISAWFRDGKSLALAFAIALSVARFGDYIALSTSAALATKLGGGALIDGYDGVLWVAAALCGASLVATLLYGMLERRALKRGIVERPTPEPFSLSELQQVRHFDVRFYLASALCATYYSGVIPFVASLTAILHSRYGYDEAACGNFSSVVILSSMILSPILGKVTDLVGRRPLMIIVGSLLILPAHLALAVTGPEYTYTLYPLWPIIVIGLSFSLVPAALWPCVALVVDEKYNATAFGVMTSIQNLSLLIVNIVVNSIRQHYGNTAALYFFVGADAVGLLFAITLYLVDVRRDGVLSAPGSVAVSDESELLDDGVLEDGGPAFEVVKPTPTRGWE